MSKVNKIDKTNPQRPLLEEASKFLKEGKIIAYPTETVYGLGVDAFNSSAVDLLYRVKKRERSKPLSILIPRIKDLSGLVSGVNPDAEKLISVFWPGPLTIIFRVSEKLPDYLKSKDRTIGIRISSNEIARIILDIFGNPITSTSANLSGKRDAVKADEVRGYFKDQVDLIIDGGICEGIKGSTIIDTSSTPPRIVREGEILVVSIEEVLKIKLHRENCL